MPGKRVSAELALLVHREYGMGLSISELSRKYGLYRSTIYNILKRIESEGRLTGRTEGGRLFKLMREHEEFLKCKLAKNPCMSLRSLVAALRKECDVMVSVETVRQAVYRLCYYPAVPYSRSKIAKPEAAEHGAGNISSSGIAGDDNESDTQERDSSTVPYSNSKIEESTASYDNEGLQVNDNYDSEAEENDESISPDSMILDSGENLSMPLPAAYETRNISGCKAGLDSPDDSESEDLTDLTIPFSRTDMKEPMGLACVQTMTEDTDKCLEFDVKCQYSKFLMVKPMDVIGESRKLNSGDDDIHSSDTENYSS